MDGKPSDAAKYMSEFIGTYLLVLSVGCNVLTGSPVWGVTSIACTLMVVIYALANVSGANFNPAVSLTLGLAKLDAIGSWATVGIYIGVQLLGGILAGLTYSLALWKTFNLAPTPGFHWYQAAFAEIIYTFMLCFVVLNCAVAKKNAGNQYFGLAIGFVVIAGGYGAGHISGGCFNPAVAFGIDVSSAGIGFGWCLAYLVFEMIGAALAAGLYRVVHPEEYGGDENTPLSAKLASEFLGTFMLVLTVGLNVIGGSKAPVFSIASSLMCMIYALGSVSGAHFNPAVTVAIAIRKPLDEAGAPAFTWADAGMYMGTQFAGGIAAGFTYMFMEGGKSFPLAPGKGYGWAQCAVAEIIFTFLLAYVVLSVATVKKPLDHYFGLAIGSCVTAGGCAIGAVSGGSLNPAVSFGIAAGHVVNGGGVVNAAIYTVFEIIGGALAAVVFAQTHGEVKQEPPVTTNEA